MVSTATRLRGSCASIASRIESLIWSAILSGWPSVTDSDVKRRRDTRDSLGTATPDDGARVATSRCPRYPATGRPRRAARTSGLPAGSRGELGRDRRPDAGGDGVLGALRQFGDRPVGGEDRGGVVR